MRNMVTRLLVALALFWSGTFGVFAQSQTQNLSGTITATGTFQLLMALDLNRKGCTIQNTSAANVMYIYLDTAANAQTATTAKARKLAVGEVFYCAHAGDQNQNRINAISITGTISDTFFAERW